MDAQDVLLQQLSATRFAGASSWALIVTMLRTEAVTAGGCPLVAGLAFVAAIIPIDHGPARRRDLRPRGGFGCWPTS
jgi:hypothetical protein